MLKNWPWVRVCLKEKITRKTEKRGIMRLPEWTLAGEWEVNENGKLYAPDESGDWDEVPCPYGNRKDRLWVREAWRTWRSLDKTKPSDIAKGAKIIYEADQCSG